MGKGKRGPSKSDSEGGKPGSMNGSSGVAHVPSNHGKKTPKKKG